MSVVILFLVVFALNFSFLFLLTLGPYGEDD